MGSAFGRSRDCSRIEEKLEAYLSGSVPEGEEQARIAAHLSICPECQSRAAAYARLHEAMTAFGTASLPERPADWESVRARLGTPAADRDTRSWRPVFNGRMAITGLAATALGIVALFAPLGRAAWNEERPFLEAVGTTNGRPDEGAGMSRLMGYTTVGTGPNTLTVAPVFVGPISGASVPLIVEVGSDGKAGEAQVEVRPQNLASAARNYRYAVRLGAQGVSRFLVYPSFSDLGRSNPSPFMNCDVTLTAPGRKQTVRCSVQQNGGTNGIAYIGGRFGAITPRLDPQRERENRQQPRVTPAYVLPENAPERAIGYASLGVVVVGPEAAAMNDAQWRAIREWVLTGGRLILTGNRLLDVPAAAELAPVQRLGYTGRTVTPKTGAFEKNVQVPEELTPAHPFMTTWRMGLGAVSYTSFDPADEVFRSWSGSSEFWRTFQRDAMNGGIPGAYAFRLAAHQRTAWNTMTGEVNPDDPFRMGLPPVRNVLLVFLGYFVLVVPMTFAVLKHTRRQNLAWLTGPILAIAFAGGIFLLTARLYFMPTARRTAGVLFLNSGEKNGRFVGSTEMFFPQAGRYAVPLRDADSVETTLQDYEPQRPVDSVVDSSGKELTATVSVGNLAFRRLYHEQSVSLPGAVTVDLQENAAGELVGYVDNQTGRPLANAMFNKVIYVPDPNRRNTQSHPYNQNYYPRQVAYRLGALPVGRTAVHAVSGDWTNTEYIRDTYPATWISNPPWRITFMADVPGEEFGPRTGRDFSGGMSVTLMVGLTTQKNGGKQ